MALGGRKKKKRKARQEPEEEGEGLEPVMESTPASAAVECNEEEDESGEEMTAEPTMNGGTTPTGDTGRKVGGYSVCVWRCVFLCRARSSQGLALFPSDE